MNRADAVLLNGSVVGWVQKRAAGGWRALSVDGRLTHHRTRKEARESLLWS